METGKMSYARINSMTFTSEKAADTIQAKYSSTAPIGFPEAELLTFVRTGPLTASLTSIYPDKAAFDRSADERTLRMKENKDLIKSVETEEGEVAFVHFNKN